MPRNPFMPPKAQTPNFVELNKSKGILDDFAVRKSVHSREYYGLPHTKIFYIEVPEASLEFPLTYIPQSAEIVEVIAVTDTGTVTFNIEKRGKLTPDTNGTDIHSSDFTATAAGISVTTFSAGTVNASSWLTVTITSVASSPEVLWLAVRFKS